jgi:hypothetical protein
LKLEEEVCFALAALAVLALLLAEPFDIKPNIFIFVTIKILFMYIYYTIIKNKINKNKINKNKINIISIKNLFCIKITFQKFTAIKSIDVRFYLLIKTNNTKIATSITG